MLTIAEILKGIDGKLLQGNLSRIIHGVSTNSKAVKKGELFIAIVGKRLDAHDFVNEAVENGAAAVIVSKRITCRKNVVLILVKDTTRALGLVAKIYRRKFSIPLIAVTGSAGKTTTKELIACILKKRYKVLKNIKTENNQYGVPLTLLKLKRSHQVAVLELGTNQPGDIAWLTEIVQPTVCVFTNIGESHLEGLKTTTGVFKEKIRLMDNLDAKGRVIYNRDDDGLSALAQRKYKFRKINYSINQNADFQAKDIRLINNRITEFMVHRHPFRLRTPAKHNVYNSLAAIACGRTFNLNFTQIRQALAGYEFGLGRQEFRKIGQLFVIDDTYNSNPASLRSAVETLNALSTKGRKILVCADMLELGSQSKSLHEAMGRVIARSSIHRVLTLGDKARFLHESVVRFNHGIQSHHCRSLDEVHEHLKNICQPGDVLLVKGSRGMKMEQTVAFVGKYFGRTE